MNGTVTGRHQRFDIATNGEFCIHQTEHRVISQYGFFSGRIDNASNRTDFNTGSQHVGPDAFRKPRHQVNALAMVSWRRGIGDVVANHIQRQLMSSNGRQADFVGSHFLLPFTAR